MFRIFAAVVFAGLISTQAFSASDLSSSERPSAIFTQQQLKQYIEADRDYCLYVVGGPPAVQYDEEECLRELAYGSPVGEGRTLQAPASDEQADADDRVHTLRTRLFSIDEPDETYATFGVWLSQLLAQYQQYHGLPPTGDLDADTVAMLDRNVRVTSFESDQSVAAEIPQEQAEPPPVRPHQPAPPAAEKVRPMVTAQVPPSAVTIDLGSLSQFLFVLAVVVFAFRTRPIVDWAFNIGGSRVASAARSPRLSSFVGRLRDTLQRIWAFLTHSTVVPKAAGVAGGLIAYFFNEPRRIAAWGCVIICGLNVLSSLAAGNAPGFFGLFIAGLFFLTGANYHFSIIGGENPVLAYKRAVGRVAFVLLPLLFTSLVLVGFVAVGIPRQQAAGTLSIIIGIPVVVLYFSFLQAYRDAEWASLCEYQKMYAGGGGGFTSIDITERILSQSPATSLDIAPVIEALREQLVGDIPPLPDSWFNVHDHLVYRQMLKDSSISTPEAEDLFVEIVVAALMTIVPKFPKPASAPLFIRQMEDPLSAVSDFMQCLIHPRAIQLRVLEKLRTTFDRNVAELSGRKGNLTHEEALEIALKDTPLLRLFKGRIPYELQIAKKIWLMHVHICAATGAFKTQLAQTLILHLIMLFGEPSFMVVDSQGPILDLLGRKFGPQLGASMLRIHPHTSPIGINPFDIDFSGMSQAQKGSAITGVADLFVGLFATGSSELSDKMRTLFDQAVRLFLIGIPAVQKRTATMRDLDDLMDCAQPWIKYKAEIEHLDERGRIFFSKHNISAYADTRSQVHQRLYSVLRDPAIERMLCAKRNELDLDGYLNQPGMVLVDTASGAIGLQNSAFLGRLFILLAQQALMRREPIPTGNPHPAFIIADEAQEYFKAHEVLEQFIDQGRKRNFGLIAIHHRFSQAPGPLQDAFEQVGVHFASEIAPSDCARLASIMRTSVSFLQSQRSEQVPPGQDPSWVDYALYFRGLKTAISVRLGYGNLENFDTSGFYAGAHGGSKQSSSQQRKQHQSPPPPPPPPPVGPKDVEWAHTISPIKAKKGCTIRGFKMPDGSKADIVIPPGTTDGTRLRFKGRSGQSGDFILKITVPPMPEQSNPEDMDTGAAPWP